MAERMMPDGDGRGGRADADVVADALAAWGPAAHAKMPARQPSVAPERWLRSETVEELRGRRARQGLPTPRTAPPPGQTDPRQASPASGEKAGGGAAAGRYVLTSMLAILLGLLVGAIAAVIVFAASAPAPGR